MSSEETFSAKEAVGIVGITYRQIDYWIRQKYFTPEIEAKGTGSRRGLSKDDLLILSLAKVLIDNGSEPEQVFREIDGFKDDFLRQDDGLLVMDGGEARFVPFDIDGINSITSRTQRNGQVTKILKTAELREQLTDAVAMHRANLDLGR